MALKASIDFGLVHIPVEIISAENREEKVSFHLLDAKDNARIRFKRVNENTGKEVEWEDIVKGYEIEENKYVIFTDEELRALEAESNKSLAIDAFVSKDEVSPALFENPYYLVPAKGGEKGYAILEKILQKSDKYGIIQAVLRNKEQLGVIYAKNGLLMLDIIRYPHELKGADEVAPAAAFKNEPSAREIQLAEKLLKEMSGHFRPDTYRDEYIVKLKDAIRQRSRSGKVRAPKDRRAVKKSTGVDIMELLSQSLKGSSHRGKKKRGHAAG